MSLSDRLHAAARDRTGQVALAPEPTPAPSSTPPPAAPTHRVLAGPTKPVAIVEADPDAPRSSICPVCSRTGQLALVDLPGRTADWGCEACGTLWQATLAAPPPTAG